MKSDKHSQLNPKESELADVEEIKKESNKKQGSSKKLFIWFLIVLIHILIFIALYRPKPSEQFMTENKYTFQEKQNSNFSTDTKSPSIEEDANYKNLEYNVSNYIRVKGKNYKEKVPSFYNAENPAPFKIKPESYIPLLEVSFIAYDKDHLNIVIRDAEKSRYEMPHEEPYPHVRNPQNISIKESNFDIFVKNDPFDIIVIRKATEEVIFKLTDRFIYSDLYLEFSFYTPTNHIYGLGERLGSLQYTPGVYTLYMLDQSGEIDPGKPGFNQQGHHSMYMMKEKSGKYHVNLLRNINAQEVVLANDSSKVTWKLIGGVIDLNFFLGDSPEEASIKYHKYLGGWTLPALWHLGHHQSKFQGYMSATHLSQIIKGFEDAKLPLESLWSDLDYTVKGKSFVLDQAKFPPQRVNELYKKHRKRWIPIVDPWISDDKNEPIYDYPRMMNLTMKDSLGKLCTGSCLFGKTIFIDYLHPETESYWQKLLNDLNNKWTFSGVWLDANEITNYQDKPTASFRDNKYFDLPFYPGMKNLFRQRIVNLDCVHYGGVEEYNVRSIPSLLQSKYTYNYLKKRFPFPLVLSRGTMFGGGQFAYTWVPDVYSNWGSIIPSLETTLTFSLFGIPMVGVDICGFIGDSKTPGDLCARWYQLAVFYPFARNAHTPLIRENNFQEPYRYKGEHYTAIENAIKVRYSLLKYLLSIFFSKKYSTSDARGAGTIMRPLFFGFHNDSTLPPYGDRVHNEQFLLGDGIMAAPVLHRKTTSLSVYFPNCRWFDLRSYKEIKTRGDKEIISANLNQSVPHFLKGGHILFKQDVKDISNSDDLSEIFTLVIGLNDFETRGGGQKVAKASGKILGSKSYGEEYIYKKCVEDDCMLEVNGIYEKVGNQIHFSLEVANQVHSDGIKVNEIYILGAVIDENDHSRKSFAKAITLKNEVLKKIHMVVIGNGEIIKLTFPPLDLKEHSNLTFVIN